MKAFKIDPKVLQRLQKELEEELLQGQPAVLLDENNLVVEPSSYLSPASQPIGSITGTITLQGADLLRETLDRLARGRINRSVYGVIKTLA